MASDATYDEFVAAGAEHLILARSGPDHRIDGLDSLPARRDSRRDS